MSIQEPLSEMECWRVRDVLENYFNALDAKDFPRLMSCFADDGSSVDHAGTQFEQSTQSAPAIVRELQDRVAKFKFSNHTTSNIAVSKVSGGAESITFAVAHLHVGEEIIVRGIRYNDYLEKRNAGWVIVRRRHIPLWQSSCAAIPVVPAWKS